MRVHVHVFSNKTYCTMLVLLCAFVCVYVYSETSKA